MPQNQRDDSASSFSFFSRSSLKKYLSEKAQTPMATQVVVVRTTTESSAQVRKVANAVATIGGPRIRIFEDKHRAKEPRWHGEDAEDQQRRVWEQQDTQCRDTVDGTAGAEIERKTVRVLLFVDSCPGRQHPAPQIQRQKSFGTKHVANLTTKEIQPDHVRQQMTRIRMAEHRR